MDARCSKTLVLAAVLCSVLSSARGQSAAPDPAVGSPAPAEALDPRVAIPGVPVIPVAGLGGPTPPAARQAAAGSGISGSLGGSVLFEKIAEDYFTTLELYNETRIGPVKFGVWVPLRFRVIDEDPADDGVLRQQDWDEPSDFARLLRFVELNLGGERWRFRGRFGALEGESLGHGTIVAGYFNNLDRDHYQAGLLLDSAVKWGGLAFLLDNVIQPEIFAFRVHARPAAFVTDNAWLNRLIVALSVAADTSAPVSLVDATPAPDSRPDIDDEGNFVHGDRQGMAILGFDVEYTLVQNELLDLVPYLDLNFLLDQQTGVGFHLGTFFNLRLPTPVGPTLLTRLEYRAVGAGYAPRYIDSLYEVQRVQYGADIRDDADLPVTKLGWLRCSTDPTRCSGAGRTGTHGWLGELYFDFAGWVKVGGSYEDYEGPDNAALTLGLHLPRLPVVQLGAYYTRRGFDGLQQAFDLDGALLTAYARARLFGPLAVTVVYSRSWQADVDGRYGSQSDFSVGAGVAIGY